MYFSMALQGVLFVSSSGGQGSFAGGPSAGGFKASGMYYRVWAWEGLLRIQGLSHLSFFKPQNSLSPEFTVALYPNPFGPVPLSSIGLYL